MCRVSGRVSSSPGKQLDTHGQEGRAEPSCYSARGMHWREAVPCSGRNAWGEMGHSVRSSSTFICHPCTRGGDTSPPTLPGCSTTSAAPQGHPPPRHHPIPTHLRGCRGPRHPAHARRGPGPALPGPAAPAPGAGHSRTQLGGGGGSQRALHRLPALAVDAGTCSPTMPEPDNMWSSLFPPRPMPFIPTQPVRRAKASPGAVAPAQRRVGKEGSAHTPPGQGESVT